VWSREGVYGEPSDEEVAVAAHDRSARPFLTVQERALNGRTARERVRRSTHGEWAPAPDRPDPLELLRQQEVTRVPDLLPVRHERMGASAFAFYRGAAIVMAADLAPLPRTGIDVQLCGDAHLANFGAYASPERILVFDINDFDETLRGPFEWDLKRLAASFEIASRANGFDPSASAAVVTAMVISYCTTMAELAAKGNLDIWYSRLTIDELGRRWGLEETKAARRQYEKNVQKVESKDRLHALAKLTTIDDGELRFVSRPPLLARVSELVTGTEYAEVIDHVRQALQRYRRTLQPDRRELFDRYRFVDLARKVVGVGSVGTRCWVALLVGRDDADPLFLQVKQAEASVLEPYLSKSKYPQHGQRVVEGQRLTQAASDVMLGWTRYTGPEGDSYDYYFRQLWDEKGGAAVETFDPARMTTYAQICGYTLARAHARSGDPIALSGYLGSGASMARALARFAVAYGDQNEADYQKFVAGGRTS
jgi:uncharacterized protein (DUF2252 family)